MRRTLPRRAEPRIHLAVEARGLPTNEILTGEQTDDNPQLNPLFDGLKVRLERPGRPRPAPRHWLRTMPTLILRPVRRCVSVGSGSSARKEATRSHAGRTRLGWWSSACFRRRRHRGRNVVKRCLARLKQFRGMVTRHAKRAPYYRADRTIVAIDLWIR